jgi:hypothetical protein
MNVDMSGKDNPFLKIPVDMPMSHRYKVYSESNKNLEWLIKEAEINYFKKEIVSKIYETANSDTHNWIEKNICQLNDKWTLVALNSMGAKLYTHIFEGLQIKDHSVRYDYAGSSEVVVHTVTFGFENFKKIA